MNRPKLSSRILSLFMLLSLPVFFAACGNEKSADSQDKTVTVAVLNGKKPLSFIDESGKLVGYEVEILQAAEKKLKGYHFDIQSVDEDAQQIGLDSGKYAIISGGLFKTKVREDKYLIPSENIGVSLVSIIKRKSDDSIHSLDDLVEKNLAPVPPNGGVFNIVTQYNNQHDKKINLKTQEDLSNSDRLQGIASKKYDAAILVASGFDELNGKLKLDLVKTDPIKISNTYLLVGKTQTDLNTALTAAIKAIKDDGTIGKISTKYFGEDTLKYKEK